VHPDIPYTSHNSAAVIHLDGCGAADVGRIFRRVKKLMLTDYIEGSDPGLAVATAEQVSAGMVAFGMDAKKVESPLDGRKSWPAIRALLTKAWVAHAAVLSLPSPASAWPLRAAMAGS
jgi:hypothetical protein